jgi:hypothetical protein
MSYVLIQVKSYFIYDQSVSVIIIYEDQFVVIFAEVILLSIIVAAVSGAASSIVPVSHLGIVKFNIALVVVQLFVTITLLHSAQVSTVPIAICASSQGSQSIHGFQSSHLSQSSQIITVQLHQLPAVFGQNICQVFMLI